jgi:hypothetical protein
MMPSERMATHSHVIRTTSISTASGPFLTISDDHSGFRIGVYDTADDGDDRIEIVDPEKRRGGNIADAARTMRVIAPTIRIFRIIKLFARRKR